MFLLEVGEYIAAYNEACKGGLSSAQMGLVERTGGELKETGGNVTPVIARLLARGEQDMAMALFEVTHPEEDLPVGSPSYGPWPISRTVSGTILVP